MLHRTSITTLLLSTIVAGILSLFSLTPHMIKPARAIAAEPTPVASDAGVAATTDTYRVYLPLLVSGQSPAPVLEVKGHARGYLTTPQELAEIKRKADQGQQPYADNVDSMLNHEDFASPDTWVSQSSLDGKQVCSDGSQKDANGRTIPRGPRYIIDGSRMAYGKMVAAFLSDSKTAEAYARSAREHILDLTDTVGWGGDDFSADNQCVLYLSWYTTGFVMAADLLEEFPAIWSRSDKQAFQQWLAREVYPKAAWASRARTNNWGSGGSYAAAMIADYLWDSGLTLEEREPKALTLSPAEAYRQHTAEQLSRMNTAPTARDKEDSRCLPYKGIQPAGGIPDELRRASISDPLSMCDATSLPQIGGGYSKAYTYQMTHVETLVAHAELALRRGDRSLYDNVAADGSGSILQAIKFVVANPVTPGNSYKWSDSRLALVYVAYHYYGDPVLKAQLRDASQRSGEVVTYGVVTHSFAGDEKPGLPPVVAAPKD